MLQLQHVVQTCCYMQRNRQPAFATWLLVVPLSGICTVLRVLARAATLGVQPEHFRCFRGLEYPRL